MSISAMLTRYHVTEDVAVITLDGPPVNSLGLAMRESLLGNLARAGEDNSVNAVIVIGAGRMFCGGGDIREFGNGDLTLPDLIQICSDIETLGKPVVAAIHRGALGGGLELALACHYRVATAGARFALPEVLLGVLPGSGGTQRLPRLIGVQAALDLILTGEAVSMDAALGSGLVDEQIEGDLLAGAIGFAKSVLVSQRRLRIVSGLPISTENLDPKYFALAMVAAQRKYPRAVAPIAIVNCVQFAASKVDFSEGVAFEREEYLRLIDGDQSKALRHLFFAEREAAKVPNLDSDLAIRTCAKVGVVGAGTMGTGIAMSFLAAGIPVRLLEIERGALDRGLTVVQRNYASSVAKGRITQKQMDEYIERIQGTVDYADLADCDLVIEAVFENMSVKRDVAAKLGEICRPGAVIATNTSTLDVDVLAEASGRPSDYLGMHFFSPANVMRLLEVVRGARTAPDVLATVLGLAKKIGKVAVVSGVCYGFIGNRMIESYLRETDFLLMEGATPMQIDHALESFGMAMGPCRMLDMAGVDIAAKVLIEREKEGLLPSHPAYRAVCRELTKLGRNGQKSGSGYYRYDGRNPVADTEVANIISELAIQHKITQREYISDEEIYERCLYPLINEGFRILDEGIAYRASDIDVIWTAGYGFPRLLGGPMYMAEKMGLNHILTRLNAYRVQTKDAHEFWTPASLLLARDEENRRIAKLEENSIPARV